MADKTFTVTHARARSPLVVKGKTLNEALEKEGLDPTIWKIAEPEPESEELPSGDNQGDDSRESH